MESRWYLFAGQTLENTKISQRAHALHITQTEWGKITKHLDRKKMIQEAIEKEEALKRYLDDGSKSMIKNWENSLENIRKRKEEAKLAEIEKIKAERMEKFYTVRREQREARKKFVDQKKKEIFMNSGNARDLTSAYVESEVLYEREKQKEFNKQIKAHYLEQEAKWAQKVKDDAEAEAKEKEEQAQKLLEKNREAAKLIKEQIAENEASRAEERARRIAKENEDRIKAAKEDECIKEAELQEKLRRKNEMKKLAVEQAEASEKKKLQDQTEKKELEDVIETYKETKHKIECMMKAREKQIRQDQINIRTAIAEKVKATVGPIEEIEEKALKAAIAEKEAAEEEARKKKKEMQELHRRERIEERKKYLENELERKKKEEELRKWEMLNNYKSYETMKKYNEQRRKENWERVLAYRKELLDQMNEEKTEQARLTEIDRLTVEPLEDPDEKFFEYADEVMELAKKGGRPTFPIERAIMDYKKMYHLLPEEIVKKCEENRIKKQCDESHGPSEEILKKSIKKKECRCQCDPRAIKS